MANNSVYNLLGPHYLTFFLRLAMSPPPTQGSFMQEVRRLRADYEKKRESTNLVPPVGRSVFNQSVDVIDGVTYYTYWYECDNRIQQDQDQYPLQCIRIADIPSTLSGAILRLERNLPALEVDRDYEIIGDEVRSLAHAPAVPDEDDDAEDVSAALAPLPEIKVDLEKHFLKKTKYESEIRNLLACQGGSCPGLPKSAHIIQLLGKSSNGELVFEKLNPRYVLAFVHPLAAYKSWILQAITALQCLHSLGIVHRDLRIDNLIFSLDSSRLLICDLEGRWGNRLAPEVSRQPSLEAHWSEKSDIYDLGYLIKGMIYGNTPITNLVEWHVPPPLDAIVESCTRVLAEQRPSLDELYAMVDKIEVTDS